MGPDGTLFEGGMFRAVMEFPKDFPSMPPKMQFLTKMWHPNIYPDGARPASNENCGAGPRAAPAFR